MPLKTFWTVYLLGLDQLKYGTFSQVQAATWAMDRGVSVVICNGMQEKAIKTIISGRKLGTFFTDAPTQGTAPVELLAEHGKCHLEVRFNESIPK